MAQCYGIATTTSSGCPKLECPQKKYGGEVKLCQGDMTLCLQCEHVRFPSTSRLNHGLTDVSTDNADELQSRSNDIAPTHTSVDTSSHEQQINNLLELSSLDLATQSYPQIFINSLSNIFQYSVKDIQSEVSKTTMETLSSLHKSLCDKITEIFPQYKNRRVVNRVACGELSTNSYTKILTKYFWK